MGLLDAVMCELGLCVLDVLASAPAAPAPMMAAPARGVLLVMPSPAARARRSPWRRRVDPARIAADFCGDGEAS